MNEIESKSKSLNDTATDIIEIAAALELQDMDVPFNQTELKKLSLQPSLTSTPALSTTRFELDSPTKFSEILRNYSIDELNPFFDDGLPFSKDTVKNHCWAFKMNMDYCQTRKIEPWPVQPKPIFGFIKLLGIGAGYNYKSVQCKKPLEVSLFLFALSAGARAHTCSHIRLQDIVRVFSKENSTFVKVTINLECGKGVRGDDHCVTVEGDIANKSTLNVVWWLEQSLVEEYGLSLTEFNEWDLDQLGRQYLWGIRKGVMRVRLQKRAKQAGYPDNIFGYHSFRSGFICSALIKGRSDPSKRDSIIEATALVGNWQAGSAAQWNYVKETEKSIVIANRLLMSEGIVNQTNFSTNL
ncbi:uncharacterized protein MONOS_14101 [Monocercomonoides exilis]|uniref:uncharacterized protein n=1 Tax=Monocercomonoides exilis TaxID=2049356 RepID=UPI0035594DBC|nr:hypothetical protein MONOS_14101 [Monocercomonoides exilis]|eukprot:MONOS_14101.1-p1 / transcript=MONOS_14101.1 / gene=MONOS_14101 / organism=Monocercomonoides_exilis_PA203 / gene_product=unspecified product / transcript_product=unspecified product / location=Mono_scaffold00938:10654-11955(-) / protein_length=354 / sequence_SO=supercontig / SO=protein_coding / is_pseudo=false